MIRLLLPALLAATVAAAQTAPSVRLPKESISYRIKVIPHGPKTAAQPNSGSGDAASEPFRLVEMRVTRTGETVRYELRWSGGKTSEVWQSGRAGLAVAENVWTGQFFVDGAGEYGPPLLTRLDDRAVSWITPENKVADTVLDGKEAAHHRIKRTVRDEDDEGPTTRTVIHQAWIDLETKLPLAMDDGDARYEFAYDLAPPTAPLVVPEHVQKEIERFSQALSRPRRL